MTNGSSQSEVKKQMFFPFLICSRITAEITTKMDYVMNWILSIEKRSSFISIVWIKNFLCVLNNNGMKNHKYRLDEDIDDDDDYPWIYFLRKFICFVNILLEGFTRFQKGNWVRVELSEMMPGIKLRIFFV